MSDDLYQRLGVGRSASQDEIRKAYRDLAKELHPDLNPGDRAAEERFKQVSAAYDLLKDPDKRTRYDRGEIDASGAEQPQYRYYRDFADTDAAHPYSSGAGFEDFVDMGDVFSDLFGRSAGGRRHPIRRRGADVRYHLGIDFLDAARGCTKRVTMPDGGTLDVAIPSGVRDGQTLRLKGKGMPGMEGGEPGAALIEIEIAPHPSFRRDDLDVLVDLPITIAEAVLGGKIEVATITGKVALTVPMGSSGGRTLRLRGQGIQHGDRKGDQLVRLQIVLPDPIDDDLESFMQSWQTTHRYDPRGKLEEVR